jgi:hypothetical protein
MTNQARQLANDVQQLGRVLRGSGATQQELQSLDEVGRALQQLSDAGRYGNPGNLQQLSQAALEKMRTLDFNIRKRIDTTNDQLFLSGAENAPANFQSAVSDYFKKLSQAVKGKGGK